MMCLPFSPDGRATSFVNGVLEMANWNERDGKMEFRSMVVGAYGVDKHILLWSTLLMYTIVRLSSVHRLLLGLALTVAVDGKDRQPETGTRVHRARPHCGADASFCGWGLGWFLPGGPPPEFLSSFSRRAPSLQLFVFVPSPGFQSF